MPKESLNVYLTATDGMSPVLASITDKTKALDKETQHLQETTNAMTKASQSLLEKQTRLQSEYDSSKKRLKELQKAFDEHHDVLDKTRLDNAIEQHAKLKNELIEVTEQLNANKRAYKENVEAIRKGGLTTEGGTALGGVPTEGGSNLSAIWSGLGIGQELSQLVEQAGGVLLNSALGNSMGGIASSALSGAITGASLGTAFAPGIGTAVGAALGGGLSAVGGMVEQWGEKDDAFKDYYGGLYEDASARSDETVESGSTIAAGREKDKISFATIFGDRDTAEQYLDDLVDMANTTPFLYDDLTAMSKTLATYGYDAQNILPQLQVIGDTGAALGMGTSDMTAVAQALGRMKSSDKTTLEYLNILNDRGIGAVGMLADAKGVSVGDMYGMISKGEVSGTEAVEIITAALKEAYSGSMLTQSKTFEGISSTLEGLEQELDNAAGEGYNTLRTEGKQRTVEAYQGELGDEMKEINTIIGENRARKENLQAQYETEVMDAVLSGKKGELWGDIDEDSQNKLDAMHNDLLEWKAKLDESKASGDEEGAALASANIEALYEEAQSMGQSLFDNSEFMKILNDTELDEIQAILDNTAGLTNATEAAYNLAQQLSKGMVSSIVVQNAGKSGLGAGLRAVGGDAEGAAASLAGTEIGGAGQANPAAGLVNFLQGAGKALSAGSSVQAGDVEGAAAILGGGKSHAFGLNRVPFDDYPALLHEGERVLTAREARAQDLADLPPLTMERPTAGAGSASESGGTSGGEDAPAVTISGNTFVGASEEMADQLWEIIVRKIEREFKAAGR